MDFANILAASSLLGTVSLGLLQWLKDKRKDDVDADTVKAASELAQDESSVRQALELRNEALEERKQTKEEVLKYAREVEKVKTEIIRLRNELNNVRNIWRHWAEDLHRRWDYHRSQETPPPLPEE